ncbi:MarR family winged helix-turn-helix transcriptional regulator [Shimia sediminis]|uniref:MarR family winged helix-turn-helix transcriptional regulator n=1 Tax=Shimia sediminis TaxID=2497945 RepID=UPI0013DEA024|nr:MarR family transcriptional regulator [Shimia sediminis]
MQPNTQASPLAANDLDPPEFHIASLNHQIRSLMDDVLRRHGLKLVEWRVLQSLLNSPALTICDLARLAVIERTVASRLIDRLAARGLVTKESLKNDRRYAQVFLTQDGGDVLRRADADVEQARSRLFAGLSADDMDILLGLVKRLRVNASSAQIEGQFSR